MYFFQRIGLHALRFVHSISFFFSFLGHVSFSSKNIFTRHLTISWHNMIKVLYYSGVTIVFPLMMISALIGMSLSFTIINLLGLFSLQQRALPIAQELLIRDILPLLIGCILCIQVSLNIINARIKITKKQQTTEAVVLEHILPIILGINLTGLLLYVYLLIATLMSLFLTFHHTIAVTFFNFSLQVLNKHSFTILLFSVIKTLIYCTIISMTAGYYYYQMATLHVSLRKVVSRILTRGFLWLTMSSVYLKFLHI